jgi:hypothetical protein
MSLSMETYLSSDDDLAQRFFRERTTTERKANVKKVQELVQSLGDRLGDEGTFKQPEDGMVQELEVLEAGLAADDAVS